MLLKKLDSVFKLLTTIIFIENFNSKLLPPIFKFSMLCRILPYYGFLHEWRVLQQFNTKTKAIWDDNIDAFIWSGKNCRVILRFSRASEIQHLNINQLNYFETWMFASPFENKAEELIVWLVNKLGYRDVLVIEQGKFVLCNRVVFWQEQELENTVASLRCHHTKTTLLESDESNQISDAELIRRYLDSKDLIIRKSNRQISIHYVKSTHLQLEWNSHSFVTNTFKSYNECDVDECTCKPKSVSISSWYLTKHGHTLLQDFTWFKNLSELSLHLCVNWSTLIKLSSILNKLVKPKIKIKVMLKEISNDLKFRYTKNKVIIVFSGTVCTFESIHPPSIQGRVVDIPAAENTNYTVVNLRGRQDFILNYSRDFRNNNIEGDWLDILKDSTNLTDDKYLIVEKDTLEWDVNIEDIVNNIEQFSCCRSVYINNILWCSSTNRRLNSYLVFCWLYLLPKHLKYKLRTLSEFATILTKENLWLLKDFKNFKIINLNIWVKMIYDGREENDIMQSKFKVENLFTNIVRVMSLHEIYKLA